MSVIFAKTLKGYEEIEKRAAGFSPRVRRVLIFVDGKRTVEDLRGLLQSDDLEHTLGMLEEEGYIGMVETTGADGVRLAPPPPQPALTAFRLHPPGDDPQRLRKARNFMVNTLNTFIGAVGTSSLQDRIDAAPSPAALRELFDEWYYAIVSSRDGRREAEQLRRLLLEVI